LKSGDELAADTLPEFLKPTWVAQEEIQDHQILEDP
jgi:hypothetical protein